jgi:ATP-dependent Clp protease ATP-binding subunit ClpC
MLERYTAKARRVLLFARYEASQFGSPYIETEHLLLGLLREDKALANRFLRSDAAVESIRKQIEGHNTIRKKVSTSVDLPLSHECKRVLAYGAEEAERLSHKHIGTEHLLLGLLREEKCFAAEILHERGLRLSTIREELVRSQSERVAPSRPKESSLLAEFSRDLIQAAMDNSLDPLIGRDYELERVVQILCRRTKNNPLLIGEPGVGKTAIVEGLAQRLAEGDVPSFLVDKRILALDLSLIVAGTKYRGQFEERLRTIMKELMENQNAIIFIDELHTVVGAGAAEGSLDAATILKPALSRGDNGGDFGTRCDCKDSRCAVESDAGRAGEPMAPIDLRLHAGLGRTRTPLRSPARTPAQAPVRSHALRMRTRPQGTTTMFPGACR